MPYTLTWIAMTALMLILIFGGLAFWIAGMLDVDVDTFDLRAGLLAQRLVLSPNGLSTVDEFTGRPLHGIIDANDLKDISKLEDKLLKTVVYGEQTEPLAAKITIDTSKDSVKVFYNQVQYDRLKPQLGARGVGGTRRTIIPMTILVREDGDDTPRRVFVEILGVNE